MNANAGQPRHVHPVVDEDDRPGLPTPSVGGFDRLEQVPVGQTFLPDLQKADPRVEQAPGDSRDLAGACRSARADGIDRGKFQESV